VVILLFATSVFFALPVQSAPASEDIGTPVFQASTSHSLGAQPASKRTWALPGGLEGAVEVIVFDVKTAKLSVRDKIPKKLRGKTPAGYEMCQFGITHSLATKDSCVYWLKPNYSFIVVSWSWDETKNPPELVLTIDYWIVK
jgi:hypothetical protein